MIPKVIHYCWFGRGPLPTLAQKCILSWKKYLPDYKIIEWNEDNYDVMANLYTKEAYEAKKYAFVSDFARFEILYKYGGLYFDTDVELIRPIDDILARGPFMGCESVVTATSRLMVAPGLGLACTPGCSVYADLLSLYKSLHFKNADGSLNLKTVVLYTTEYLDQAGLKQVNELQEVNGIWIYPVDYFCPISTEDGILRITSRTISIHHYAQSWQSPVRKWGRWLILKIGGYNLKRFFKYFLK